MKMQYENLRYIPLDHLVLDGKESPKGWPIVFLTYNIKDTMVSQALHYSLYFSDGFLGNSFPPVGRIPIVLNIIHTLHIFIYKAWYTDITLGIISVNISIALA